MFGFLFGYAEDQHTENQYTQEGYTQEEKEIRVQVKEDSRWGYIRLTHPESNTTYNIQEDYQIRAIESIMIGNRNIDRAVNQGYAIVDKAGWDRIAYSW